MLRMAPTVSAGAEPTDGVARVKSWPQVLGSPAMPPAEFTQLATMSASVWRAVLEAEKKVGKVWPGTVPLDALAYSFAVSNAVCNCEASLVPELTLEYELIKFESAATAPTVVNSLITM